MSCCVAATVLVVHVNRLPQNVATVILLPRVCVCKQTCPKIDYHRLEEIARRTVRILDALLPARHIGGMPRLST